MMWRLALAVLLTATLSLFALNAPRAQFNGCTAGFCSPPVTSVTYVGPGNITGGGILFGSTGRAYNATYAASNGNLADLVATGNGTAVCTLKSLSTGFVNLTSSACSGQTPVAACAAANGGACSVTKLYDQTASGACGGSCDMVQATLANMPALTFNALNGLPCAAGTNNTSTVLATAGNITQSAPFTYTAVGERTGNFAAIQNLLNNNTINFIRFAASANTISFGNGANISLTAADSAPHAMLMIASATAPLAAIDSSANTSTTTTGTTALAHSQGLVGRTGGGQGLTAGLLCEAGLWPADLNASYQAELANARSAIYGWNF
jgi:hypothetical protein